MTREVGKAAGAVRRRDLSWRSDQFEVVCGRDPSGSTVQDLRAACPAARSGVTHEPIGIVAAFTA